MWVQKRYRLSDLRDHLQRLCLQHGLLKPNAASFKAVLPSARNPRLAPRLLDTHFVLLQYSRDPRTNIHTSTSDAESRLSCSAEYLEASIRSAETSSWSRPPKWLCICTFKIDFDKSEYAKNLHYFVQSLPIISSSAFLGMPHSKVRKATLMLVF